MLIARVHEIWNNLRTVTLSAFASLRRPWTSNRRLSENASVGYSNASTIIPPHRHAHTHTHTHPPIIPPIPATGQSMSDIDTTRTNARHQKACERLLACSAPRARQDDTYKFLAFSDVESNPETFDDEFNHKSIQSSSRNAA